MPGNQAHAPTPLAAKSPFELRVNLGKDVPESDVRLALATGDMGFLHPFTTGATVDGPGVRVVAWTTGCMWRCLYCHNPDTWTMSNGIPVTVARAVEELRKYRVGLKIMSGGFTLSGGEPLLHPDLDEIIRRIRSHGVIATLITNGYLLSRNRIRQLNRAGLDRSRRRRFRHARRSGPCNQRAIAISRTCGKPSRSGSGSAPPPAGK